MNTTYSPTLTLFAFHTSKKQYFDTLHKQMKKGMHLRMQNNDFDILLRSVHYSVKAQIVKIHNDKGWLVGCFFFINVDLAIFQPYLDLEAGDNQSLKIQVARRGIEPGPLAPQAESLTTRPPLFLIMIKT